MKSGGHEGFCLNVRIPIPIVVGISLLAVASFWGLRTRNMDFLTPNGVIKPLPDFMTDPAGNPASSEPVLGAEFASSDTPAPSPDPNKSDLDLGDLESSPGLAEYSEYAAKGAGYLVNLATELELQGHWDRSLLAWERVLDSCHPSPQERKTAENAMVRIRPTLTHWNIDPGGDIPLLLQLGNPRRASDNFKQSAQEAADFLRGDSDHTLLIEARITTSPSRNTAAGSPISVSFSGSGKSEPQPRSMMPGNDEVEHYRLLILSNSYQLVRQELANVDGIVPPLTSNHPGNPRLDFQRQVTRLHWLRFAESLNRSAPAGN